MDFEEHVDPSEGVTIAENGEYLCVTFWEHPLHVYKVVSTDEAVHPSVARMEHNGKIYKLAWIEDDKV